MGITLGSAVPHRWFLLHDMGEEARRESKILNTKRALRQFYPTNPVAGIGMSRAALQSLKP
jgi:CxxC motif-containing protein (DUF1111 family)